MKNIPDYSRLLSVIVTQSPGHLTGVLQVLQWEKEISLSLFLKVHRGDSKTAEQTNYDPSAMPRTHVKKSQMCGNPSTQQGDGRQRGELGRCSGVSTATEIARALQKQEREY